MGTSGRGAIFSGASWDATVSSQARLRWSHNLKRDSRACRSRSKLARAARVAASETKSRPFHGWSRLGEKGAVNIRNLKSPPFAPAPQLAQKESLRKQPPQQRAT